MRRSIASIAIIRRRQDDHVRWLAQWNDAWRAYNFVGGHKLHDESHRECVSREVTEELGLTTDDFAVSDDPMLQVSYIAHSRRAQEDTLYTMELFEVHLISERAERGITCKTTDEGKTINRWLTEAEIRNHQCSDGEAVSETMELLLNELIHHSSASSFRLAD